MEKLLNENNHHQRITKMEKLLTGNAHQQKITRIEKMLTGNCHHRIWFAISFSFLSCLLLLSIDYSSLVGGKQDIFDSISFRKYFKYRNFSSSSPASSDHQETKSTSSDNVCITDQFDDKDGRGKDSNNNNITSTLKQERQPTAAPLDSCAGKYIYIHDLPSRFNDDLVTDCKLLMKWSDMCPSVENLGMGPQIRDPRGVLLNSSWFSTNQFMLELIFRKRMNQYDCLTNDSSKASAIYVPFYAGLEIGRHLWGYNVTVRDSAAIDLLRWLVSKPEWKRMWGRDHFLVAGRIAWDFNRPSDNDVDWGSIFMLLPESLNMTMLAIESSCRSNEYAIPYPTYFHPSSQIEVLEWQNRMRTRERKYLFSFAGGPRPNMGGTVRGEIFRQCLESSKICKLFDCSNGNCDDPVEVIKIFQDSVFCLQPPGDSYTRRSTFDSILAGCIPVFFHPGSAYAQYVWHFPKNYTKYSIFINMEGEKRGKVIINETLLGVTKDDLFALREEVIKLIPNVVYADPRFNSSKSIEDAFNVTMKGVLERTEKIRKALKEGKDPNTTVFADKNIYGVKGACKWDKFYENL